MRLKIILLVSLTATLLVSCGQNGQGTIDNYCLLTDYIYISDSDVLTNQTAVEILQHNELRESTCKE